jgi:hypothetical protein
MPSAALADWKNIRLARLDEVDGQCASTFGRVQAFADAVPIALQFAIQLQCVAGRNLETMNVKMESLRKDFDRFGVDLGASLAMNPANALRVTPLTHLNLWRNYAAHDKKTAPTNGGPFTLATVRAWRDACDGLATDLDGIMYNHLRAMLSAPPR